MLNFVCSNFLEVFSHRNVFLLHNHVPWGWGSVPLCRGCTLVRGTDLCWQWWYSMCIKVQTPDSMRLYRYPQLGPWWGPSMLMPFAESLTLIFSSLVANLFLVQLVQYVSCSSVMPVVHNSLPLLAIRQVWCQARRGIVAHHPGLKNIQQYYIIVSKYSTLVAEDIFPYIYMYIFICQNIFSFFLIAGDWRILLSLLLARNHLLTVNCSSSLSQLGTPVKLSSSFSCSIMSNQLFMPNFKNCCEKGLSE